MNTRVRRWNSRFVRNTINFSECLRNLRPSLALHACFSDWCRINPSIRCTPAMEVGLTDHVWEIEELIDQINVEHTREGRYLNQLKPFGPPAPVTEEEDVPYHF